MTAQTKLATVARVVANAPVVSPTTSVLRDDKTIMTLATVIGAILVYIAPELKAYHDVLVVLIMVAGLILTGHQAVEDYLKALAEYKAAVPAPLSTTPVTITDSNGASRTILAQVIASNGPLPEGKVG